MRFCLTRTVFLLAAISLSVFNVCAQKKIALEGDKIKQIEAIISAEMSKQKIPGFSIAIVANRRLIWSNGYGVSDIKDSSPIKTTTVFRLASVSKPITATAVLQLVERNKIALDMPIQTYCPEFPEKKWQVTVRQLLGHLGGIRHYKSDEEYNSTTHYNNIKESLSIFKADDLKSEPGSKYLYSTFGYSLLGCAVEGASSMSFIDYLHKNIFATAGMKNLTLDNSLVKIPNISNGYAKNKNGEIINTTAADTSSKIPGGGLVGTVLDLAKFAIAIQEGQLLTKETLNLMWTRQKTTDGKEINYGMGWVISEQNGQKEVNHGGAQQGATTYLYMQPDNGLAIAMMMNMEEVERRADMSRQIARIVLEK